MILNAYNLKFNGNKAKFGSSIRYVGLSSDTEKLLKEASDFGTSTSSNELLTFPSNLLLVTQSGLCSDKTQTC